ncbi:MAG TPA: hypothetical protein VGI74_05155 [Streptosporangiaceae bacterium]|jgi:hypothetical protein
MRPLLLLDVGGVLNPFGGPCPPGFTAEAQDWGSTRAEATLLIPVSPAIGLTRQAVDLALAWARNL